MIWYCSSVMMRLDMPPRSCCWNNPAGKPRQVHLFEGLADEPVGLVQVKAVVEGDNAGGVLAAVLDRCQALQQRAGDVVVSDDAQDSTHNYIFFRQDYRMVQDSQDGVPFAKFG